jgi:hypothetical protein
MVKFLRKRTAICSKATSLLLEILLNYKIESKN